MTDRALRRFAFLYACANAGVFVAFLPLLSVAVPLRAEHLASVGKVALLSKTLLAGVIVATFANLAGGILSDWSRRQFGTRRPWLWLGLAGTWSGYAAIAMATNGTMLILGVMLFQLCLNLLFAPLTAIFADKVPDEFKGRTSGLVNLALPVGSLVSALVGLPLFANDVTRIAVIAMLSTAPIVPLLLVRRMLPDVTHATPSDQSRAPDRERRPFRTLWITKLLVQLAGNVVIGYFLFYLQDLPQAGIGDPDAAQLRYAKIVAVATIATALVSLVVGRWSDRIGRRRPFLIAAILVMIAGLSLLIFRQAWTALAGYTLLCVGLGSFMTVDAALVAQILPSDRHRGRDLGIMNMANTLPAIVAPTIVMAVLQDRAQIYPSLALILLLALGTGAATLCVSRSIDRL